MSDETPDLPLDRDEEPAPPRSVHLVLGSNIEPRRHLPEAVRRLVQGSGAGALDVVRVSAAYCSPPVGAPGTPPFLNAAVEVRTRLSPAALKYGLLRPLEEELGRVRSADRNAPRPIDLDIALYGDLILDQRRPPVRVPDPEILTRAHVAVPLAEIAPALRHPRTGEKLGAIAERLRASTAIEALPDLQLRPEA